MAFRATSDTSLVAQPSDPGKDGIDVLYRRHGASIRRFIERQFGKGPPDPEDAVQAAFEGLTRMKDRETLSDPVAFLRRSARNYVLDHYRARKVRVLHASEEQVVAIRSDDLDAERVLSAKERLAIVERTIRSMDQRRRDVLIMNRIHGMNLAEIARMLGCSPTLVKIRLAEAIVLCERALRAADGDE
jgi:RNA polymerase sigma factor (sigma-70 family)